VRPELSNQNENCDVYTMAAALSYARIPANSQHRDAVLANLAVVTTQDTEVWDEGAGSSG
jgi:hypothetical protein